MGLLKVRGIWGKRIFLAFMALGFLMACFSDLLNCALQLIIQEQGSFRQVSGGSTI
jgi:hypothetical protein